MVVLKGFSTTIRPRSTRDTDLVQLVQLDPDPLGVRVAELAQDVPGALPVFPGRLVPVRLPVVLAEVDEHLGLGVPVAEFAVPVEGLQEALLGLRMPAQVLM